MIQREAGCGIDAGFALLHTGDPRNDRVRSGCNDDLVCCVAVRTDLYGLRSGKHGFALNELDLIRLAQRLDAGGQFFHDRGAEALYLLPVNLNIGADDADVRAVCCGLIDLGGVEHGLCRHAAAVEAGAAYLVLLNERHLRAELGCADCRNIAAGASADHQNTVFLCCRRCRCCCRGWCGSCDRRGGRRRNSFARFRPREQGSEAGRRPLPLRHRWSAYPSRPRRESLPLRPNRRLSSSIRQLSPRSWSGRVSALRFQLPRFCRLLRPG